MGWSEKYKKSIDCDNPKGFSQRAHCQGRKKKMQEAKEQDHEVSMAKTQVKKSIDNLQKVARVLAKKTDANNLPAWVQAKLTDTEHNTDAAASYMGEEKRDGKSAKDKDYSLHDWFKGGGWVQAGGKYDGKPCAKQPGQKTKPFCRDADDRAAMSKEERNKRAKKKRKEDPNPNRKGKAKIVTAESYNTAGTRYEKEKDPVNAALADAVKRQKMGGEVLPKMPVKMADSYSNWRAELEQLDELAPLVSAGLALGAGALGLAAIKRAQDAAKSGVDAAKKGQKIQPGTGVGQAAYGLQRRFDANREAMKLLKQETEVKGEMVEQSAYDPKYPIGKPVGYNNPKPKPTTTQRIKSAGSKYGPEAFKTEMPVFSTEEKDACYKKVKARYDVWPSAYASGALVKCRKVGAANWGNKTKKEGYEFSNWRDDFQPIEIETTDLITPDPIQVPLSNLQKIEEKCWVGYKQVGMKEKGKKMVPNCVKEEKSNWRDELSERYAGSGHKPPAGWKPYGGYEKEKPEVDATANRIKAIRDSIKLKEDWQKVNKGDKTDGMSQKAVDAYRRENPGSKLKTAVTEKDPGPGRSKRRKSFCARSKGQQDMHNIDCSKEPDKAICKARRRWRC